MSARPAAVRRVPGRRRAGEDRLDAREEPRERLRLRPGELSEELGEAGAQQRLGRPVGPLAG